MNRSRELTDDAYLINIHTTCEWTVRIESSVSKGSCTSKRLISYVFQNSFSSFSFHTREEN